MAKRLSRSATQRMIGGVCGGLAEYFDLDVSLVRLVFVGIALVSLVLPMLVFYVVAWAVIPGPSASPPKSPPGPPIPA